MPFDLTIADGKGRGERFEFDASDVTIGRGAENDVVLHDAGVSRHHARIQQSGQGYMLSDNGSANGTELNGQVIAIATALRSGDLIGVGPIVFEFAARRAAPAPRDAGGETRITAAAQVGDGRTRVTSLPGAGKAAGSRTLAPRTGGKIAEQQRPLAERFAALPLQARGALVAVALALVGLAVWAAAASRKPKGLACPEVVTVDDDMAGFSFGRGGVDVDCGGAVSFGFNAPAKTRVLFHYLPTNISQPTEVELKLNGQHVAWAPAAGARGEPQVLALPAEELTASGRNVLTFTEAQRGKDWSLSKVRVELLAIVPGDIRAARAAYDLGRRKLEERRVAPRNLYDAWKYFLQARRSLEGLSPRPPLYGEVAQLIKDAERDLDKECATLFFTASRYETYGEDAKAQQSYREVLMHFPSDDPSSCRKRALANIVSTPASAAGD